VDQSAIAFILGATLSYEVAKRGGWLPFPEGYMGGSAHGRLMLTVLGGLAEFERELIRARTGDGRKEKLQR
jgi:DNA invertase Pin-like site-specific DNA recombinase